MEQLDFSHPAVKVTPSIEEVKQTIRNLPLPQTELMTITPEMAQQWLNENNGKRAGLKNRHKRESHIRSIAADMQAGRWMLNGETIKFSDTGILLDGQHRLSACVLANMPFQSFVVKGLPEPTFSTMDVVFPRNGSGVLSMHGEVNCSQLSAGIRAAYTLLKGTYIQQENVTNAQVLEFLEAHPTIREYTMPSVNIRNMMHSPQFVGLRYLTYLACPVTAEQFWHQLEGGEGLHAKSPARVLRDKLISNRISSAKLHTVHITALTIKAWNAFYGRKEIQVLRWSRDEGFPEIRPTIRIPRVY